MKSYQFCYTEAGSSIHKIGTVEIKGNVKKAEMIQIVTKKIRDEFGSAINIVRIVEGEFPEVQIARLLH